MAIDVVNGFGLCVDPLVGWYWRSERGRGEWSSEVYRTVYSARRALRTGAVQADYRAYLSEQSEPATAE